MSYPVSASIKIVYSLGEVTNETVVISKTINSDMEKKVFDLIKLQVDDKVGSIKNFGLLKLLMGVIS